MQNNNSKGDWRNSSIFYEAPLHAFVKKHLANNPFIGDMAKLFRINELKDGIKNKIGPLDGLGSGAFIDSSMDSYESMKAAMGVANSATGKRNTGATVATSKVSDYAKKTSSLLSARSRFYDEEWMERAKRIDKRYPAQSAAKGFFGKKAYVTDNIPSSNSHLYSNILSKDANRVRETAISAMGLSVGYKGGGRSPLTASTFFKKSAMAATIGSGIKRETFMNSLGLLTRHQKEAAKAGGLAGLQSWMIPGGAFLGGAMTLSEGGGIMEYGTDFVLPGMGILGGWSVGKNAGFGIGVMTGAGRKTLLGMGGALGGIGAAAGLVAAVAIGEGIKSLGDSNSEINQLGEHMKYSPFNTDVNETQNTLTHRRRILSKIAKSGMNDRGALLGSEAGIVAGII